MNVTAETLHSESDVEQKLIAPLLMTDVPNGLGYSKSDFRTKIDIRGISIDKGTKKKLYYPDYAIVLDGIPALIIEAKAPGEDLIEAIREARLYSLEINASYPSGLNPCRKIIATDGKEIVCCAWDSDTPLITLDRSNLNPLDPEFQKFQEFAGRKALKDYAEKLSRSLRPGLPYFKPTQLLGGKAVANEGVGENSFGVNVSIEYKYLFNPRTLDERSALVSNAYVTSKRKQAHVGPIDRIIRAAVPRHIVDARPIADTAAPREIIEELQKSRTRNEICLLVGSVGSGKSTFTDYLRLVALPGDVTAKTSWINVNLNLAPLSKDLVYNWIINELLSAIRLAHSSIDFDELKFLRKIYAKQLLAVEKGRASLYDKTSERYADIISDTIAGLQADRVETLRSISDLLYRSSGNLLIVALDNCDKRTRDDQLLMFDVASWLKTEFKCVVFLPIRDTTYDQYKSEPPLDTVIKDLVFRIDPPLLERVIYARLEYAMREISKNSQKFTYQLSNGIKVECARGEVGEYLKSIIASLFQDNFFKRVVTGLAGRNIRKGLEILLDFCKSGHIEESEILKIRSSDGEHLLPNHIISKILLKGKRRYYSDSESNIRNLFDSVETDPFPNPFVRVAILQWLKTVRREYGPNRTRGFHKVDQLLLSLQTAGFSKERVIFELGELHKAGCVSSESQDAELDIDDLISLAPAGLVHLDLLRNVNYLSIVAEDTLFADKFSARKIANNLTGKGLFKVDSRQSTISNSKLLVDYLSDYSKNHFIGDSKIITTDVGEDLVGIGSVAEYVSKIADNDETFKQLTQIQDEYPVGEQIEGLVVSVQNYGFFVEFGLHGRGIVHSSQFNGLNSNPVDPIEAGDWVIIEILSYRVDHRRFDLKLIDR